MKKSSVIYLAAKNLYHNFSRSLLTLLSITLLSIIILTMCNLSYYYNLNNDTDLDNEIKENGIEVSLAVDCDNKGNCIIERLPQEDIVDFIEKTKELNIFQEYSFYYRNSGNCYFEDTGRCINFKPCLVEELMILEGKPDVISGEYWTEEDFGQDYIWLSEEVSLAQNKMVGDAVTVNIYGTSCNFIVKGIVDENCYIDYKYLFLNSVTVIDDVNDYDISIIKTLKTLKKTEYENASVEGITLEIYNFSVFYKLFVIGICMFLTLLCILLSMGCILNTLKISIEDNDTTIGIMKALGMRNRSIFLYIISQIFIIVIIATILSTFISYLIAKFTLNIQLGIILEMFSYGASKIIGFNFLLPLLNIFILFVAVFLGSLKILKKYLKKDAITLIQEVE
jgi:ABC-type lipoprotein release transport system permease subunit